MSRDLDAEMTGVRKQFAAMAARCGEELHLALEAFWTGSKEKMADVEALDSAVDADEKAIDGSLLRVLALRQPVASDLRTLTALFKLVTDLERIGDEAVDISRGTAPASDDAEPIRARLRKMAGASEAMLQSAVSSFVDGDAPEAERVLRTNGTINATYQETLDDVVAFISRHPTEVASAVAAANVGKCLRRVADHAKNIAEGTLFVIRGEDMPR